MILHNVELWFIFSAVVIYACKSYAALLCAERRKDKGKWFTRQTTE